MTNKKKESKFQSNYVPYDVESGINEFEEGVQIGETCHVDALAKIFAWMRGHVNGFYGWSNDGKGTMLDFLEVVKSKFDDHWKWCSFRMEDMNSSPSGKIQANRIYKNLAWTLTGKTWIKQYAEKHACQRMNFKEEQEAMAWVIKHFYVVYPRDRQYKSVLDEFKFMHEVNGISGFNIDPWNGLILPVGDRGDQQLMNVLIEIQQFALETNSVVNIVNHAKSMADQKDGKGKDAQYKIVNQFMQLGGAGWDIKMDGQFSIYRQERHISPTDPKVTFINLKQRAAEVVGVNKGEYNKIIFDPNKRRYFFDGYCPIDGSMTVEMARAVAQQPLVFGNRPLHKIVHDEKNTDVPF